ncbi:MAG: sulfatase-like hydrolase/transferase [Planctomycetaceae bacterium]|nr:sulfatase-like hydrolase/transferase [Planctomycetaceae bacterium]
MSKRKRPNILFLFTDDQRADTIAALGNRHIFTPNMDRLVAEGTACTRNYIFGGTSGAVCMPSRAMLHSSRTLFHIQEQGQEIPPEHTTLGECLQAAGYRTFGTGKWHNAPPSYARSFACGDRIFFGGMSEHFQVPLNHFDPTGRYPTEAIYNEDKMHSSDLFSESAINFIRGHDKRQPFFAYVAYTAPHDPRDTHQRFHDMYDADRLPTPENFMPLHPFDNGDMKIRDEMLAGFPRSEQEIHRHLAEYYAMITHIDDRIGQIFKALEETGQWDNTIIVFAGDNGLALGRHGLMGKQNLYEHSVTVPLIFAGPGIPRGQRRTALTNLIDIYPTLCELIGIDAPETVEGSSLVKVLHDDEASVRDAAMLAYRHLHRGVRQGRWKLIEYVIEGARTTQLFDLDSDPFELNNLAADSACASHLKRLRKRLVAWRDDMGDTCSEFWSQYHDA